MTDLVIARYNEDLTWLNEIKNKNINIVIYNKGLNNISLDNTKLNFKIITMPNHGREAGAYLKYIIDNYPNFKKNTIFIQGEPFEHLTNLPRFENQELNNIDSKHYLHYLNIHNNYSQEFNLIKYFNSDNFSKRNLSDFEYTRPSLNYGCSNVRSFDFRELLNELFINPPDEITWCVGAQFVIDRESILNRTKAFYERLNDLSLINNYDNIHSGAHVLERIWGVVFDKMILEKKV